MTKLDESLAETFDMDPPEDEPKKKIVKKPKPKKTDVVKSDEETSKPNDETDYKFAQANIKSLLEKGDGLLENAISVAQQADAPRAFEVAGNILKTLAELNKNLLDIHEKKNKIQGVVADKKGKTVESTTNNSMVFVGNTSEVQKQAKKLYEDHMKTIEQEGDENAATD